MEPSKLLEAIFRMCERNVMILEEIRDLLIPIEASVVGDPEDDDWGDVDDE